MTTDNFNSLNVDQTVTVTFDGDKGQTPFSGRVKKVRDKLLALTIQQELTKSPHFKVGASVFVRAAENGHDLYHAKIEKESFPLIVLTFTKATPAKTLPSAPAPVLTPQHKTEDDKFTKDRNSARISDSFDIEFYPVDKDKVAEKVKDYTSRPTALRREKASAPLGGMGGEEILGRIGGHVDPVVVEALSDIYRKLSMLNNKLAESSGKPAGGSGKGDNIGICVDISGGGLKILVNKPQNKGTVVKLMISPPTTPPFSISALGEVMRCSKANDPEHPGSPYELGVSYYAMHEEDKEQIIQYTFRLQHEMLRLRRLQKGEESPPLDMLDGA